MRQSFELSYPADEFDLPLCVSSGQVFRWQDLGRGQWLGIDGGHWFSVKMAAGERISFSIESNGAENDFRRLFRLEWDSADINRQILERGPELAPYTQGLPGLRIMAQSEVHEVLFTFMCTPNNHLGRITQMVAKLASYGPQIDEQGGCPIYRFPATSTIADIPEDDLRKKGFGYRARSIPLAAKQVFSKPDGWLEDLKRADYKSAHAELVSIHGIGPKLADCIALFGLHQMEAVPIDTHVWQAACRLYFPEWKGKPLTAARYMEFGDFFRNRFGDLAGWAHQYLFYENLRNWRSRKGDRPL